MRCMLDCVPLGAVRSKSCHPCGTVQIFDLGNSSHAKDAQESKLKAPLDWLRPTAECIRSRGISPAAGRTPREGTRQRWAGYRRTTVPQRIDQCIKTDPGARGGRQAAERTGPGGRPGRDEPRGGNSSGRIRPFCPDQSSTSSAGVKKTYPLIDRTGERSIRGSNIGRPGRRSPV